MPRSRPRSARAAAQATIVFRGDDGSNQLNGYADTTGYTPKNTWDKINVPWRWQPLCVLTATGVANGKPHLPVPPDTCVAPNYSVQPSYTPHWKNVKSFALTSPHQFVPPGPPKLANGSYDPKDVDTALVDTRNLDDTKKVTPSTGPTGHGRSSRPATGRCSPRRCPASGCTAWTPTSSCSSCWATRCWTPASRPGRPSTPRLLASGHRHPPPLRRQAGQLLARPLPGLRHGRRQQVATLPGAHRGHPAVPRVHLRAHDLQRRRPHRHHRLHRQRQLQRRR